MRPKRSTILRPGVAIVDVDGDAGLDIVFTHRGLEGVSYLAQCRPPTARARFRARPLPGVTAHAYAMGWGDLNDDGLLDLVTGSYGAELKQRGIDGPQDDGSTGVVVHMQREDGSFVAEVLDAEAETLSIGLVNMTGDGQPEIPGRQRFCPPRSGTGQREDNAWTLIEPFVQTSHSTMSLAWGDILNRGGLAYFTTDMAPYDTSPEVLAQWQPLMEAMGMHHEAGDPQIMANVLQMPCFATQRPAQSGALPWRGRHRLGLGRKLWRPGCRWLSGSLRGQRGDRQRYVRPPAQQRTHRREPGISQSRQRRLHAGAGLGVSDRRPAVSGMVMGDLDGDGDLDIVVNNLRGYAQLFENRLCGEAALEVELRWPGSANTRAIGAEVYLTTEHGIQQRDVRASGGYLSGDPGQIHFGIPADNTIQGLEIVWPDGVVSSIPTPRADSRLTISREDHD